MHSRNLSVLLVMLWVTPSPLERDVIYGWSQTTIRIFDAAIGRDGGDFHLPRRRDLPIAMPAERTPNFRGRCGTLWRRRAI